MYSWDNAQVVLVGNKCDLEDDRVVTADRGQKLAERLGNTISVVAFIEWNLLPHWTNDHALRNSQTMVSWHGADHLSSLWILV